MNSTSGFFVYKRGIVYGDFLVAVKVELNSTR